MRVYVDVSVCKVIRKENYVIRAVLYKINAKASNPNQAVSVLFMALCRVVRCKNFFIDSLKLQIRLRVRMQNAPVTLPFVTRKQACTRSHVSSPASRVY